MHSSDSIDTNRPETKHPYKWDEVKRVHHSDCRIFEVERVTFHHKPRNQSGEFFVINTKPWVHVIGLTPEKEVVMVQQFRFGSQTLSWEVPGGLMERGESPIDAGLRELREETGFTGDEAELIATISPNPAIQSNYCNFVLVKNVQKTSELEWDEAEEILTQTVPYDEVVEWAHNGKMIHSLSITSLFYLSKYL